MEIEGKSLQAYFSISKVHLLLLIAWSVLSFILTKIPPTKQIGVFMIYIAPVFMALIFIHLGWLIGATKKWGKLWQAVYAGKLVGCITGFISGLLLIHVPEIAGPIALTVIGIEISPGFWVTLIAGIVTSFFRALFGILLAWIGWSLK